jgi:hypothetical protein
MVIDSSTNNIGFGYNVPTTYKVDVNGTLNAKDIFVNGTQLTSGGGGDGTGGWTNSSSNLYVTDAVNVSIGHTSSFPYKLFVTDFSANDNSNVRGSVGIETHHTGIGGPNLQFLRSGSGGQTKGNAQTGDFLGELHFKGYGGGDYRSGATVYAVSEATFSSSSAPTSLSFRTSASGSTTPTEHLILDSVGNLSLQTTNTGIVFPDGSFQSTAATGGSGDGTGGWSVGSGTIYNGTNGLSVGIGTVTPTLELDVNGSTDGEVGIKINNDNTGANAFTRLSVSGDTASTSVIHFSSGSTSTWDGFAQANYGRLASGSSAAGLILTTFGANPLYLGTNGVERMVFDASGNVVVNNDGDDSDFRVEGDTEPNLLFVDAGNGRVGIGATPEVALHVNGSTNAFQNIRNQNINTGASAAVSIGAVANAASFSLNTYSSGYSGTFGGQSLTDSATLTTGTSGFAPSRILIGTAATIPIHFVTNDLTRLTIASSGEVGIGTNAPTGLLHINMSDAADVPFRIEDQSGNTVAEIEESVNSGRLFLYGAGDLRIWLDSRDSRDTYFDTPSGNVGIGTRTPLAKLEAAVNDTGTASVATPLRIAHYSSGTVQDGFAVQMTFGTPDDGGGFATPAFIRANLTDASSGTEDGALIFGTLLNAVSSEQMRITATGDVGIGTSTPVYRLYVEDDDSTVTGVGVNNPNSGSNAGAIVALTGQSSGLQLRAMSETTSGLDWADAGVINAPSSSSGGLILNAESAGIYFRTGNTNRMHLDVSTGYLGIGTTDASQMLEVNGGVRYNTSTSKPACSATVRGTNWFEQSGASTADNFYSCMKNSTDGYNWVLVATGG